MRPKVTTRYNEAVAVERGPLVYSLRIGEEWTRVNADKPHRELPHGDFEVRPTTPWNYGLAVDPTRPERRRSRSRSGRSATGRSRRRARACWRTRAAGGFPSWKLAHGWAGEISPADVAWSDPGQGGDRPAARGRDADPLRLHQHPDHGVPQGIDGESELTQGNRN